MTTEADGTRHQEARHGQDPGTLKEVTAPSWLPKGRADESPDVTTIACAGVLFIGDPHLGTKRPGMRTDVDFTAVSLDKLEQAVAIANEKTLVPIITGDLVDLGDVNDLRLLSNAMRILKNAWTPAWYDQGNHSLTLQRHQIHHELSDRHTISLLLNAGALKPFRGSGEPDLVARTDDGDIVVGAVGYGRPIPANCGPEWAFADGALRVLVTHHDLTFPGRPIPKSAPLKRIAGIDLVVNGHIHDLRKPVLSGKTWWFNPGNILRLSIDLAGHAPSVFALGPGHDGALPYGIEQLKLRYDPNVFDHTGRLVPAHDDEDGVAALGSLEDGGSVFVSLLADERREHRTEDASILRDELEAIYARRGTRDAVRDLMGSMIDDVPAPAHGPGS